MGLLRDNHTDRPDRFIFKPGQAILPQHSNTSGKRERMIGQFTAQSMDHFNRWGSNDGINHRYCVGT